MQTGWPKRLRARLAGWDHLIEPPRLGREPPWRPCWCVARHRDRRVRAPKRTDTSGEGHRPVGTVSTLTCSSWDTGDRNHSSESVTWQQVEQNKFWIHGEGAQEYHPKWSDKSATNPSSPRYCGPAGWSLFSVACFCPCGSGSRWRSPRQRPGRCPWPTSPPHSSACGTPASPSHSWEHAPSRTGRGCWSRCKGQAHVPPLHTYFFPANGFI